MVLPSSLHSGEKDKEAQEESTHSGDAERGQSQTRTGCQAGPELQVLPQTQTGCRKRLRRGRVHTQTPCLWG